MSDTLGALNRAKRRLREGGLVLCMGLRQARTPDIPVIAAQCGFDAIYVDLEHSPTSLETTSVLCTAALGAGITPLVRVPGHDIHMASRVLDAGAHGVIFPHVNTRAEAEAIVAACRFPPLGRRSVMGPSPALGYRPMPLREVNSTLNAETLLIAMLETAEGIENADAIAQTGVDVLLIGSNDLCTELGIPGELRHPKLLDAFHKTAGACRAHGKVLGIGGVRGDLELQSDLFKLGGRFIIAGSDVTYFTAAASADAKRLREKLTP
jgi:2-keto-3-deoxy-L-rhamnonate aldolase RhmA